MNNFSLSHNYVIASFAKNIVFDYMNTPYSQKQNQEKTTFFLYNTKISNYKLKFLQKVLKKLPTVKKNMSPVIVRFAKYYYVGLGYKMYVIRGVLFIWVGLTHYTLLKIPREVFVFAKKKRIFILGNSVQPLQNFLATIRRVKKKDIYKSKGLLEVKTYKNFVRMKTGKKKQY